MADGFIVRRGGKAGEPTPAPTITFVSKTDSSITFTLTNNSVTTRDVTYGLTTPPEDETISLASEATSANQTISGLDPDEEYTIFAQAEDSAIVSLTVTTDPVLYALDFDGTDDRVDITNNATGNVKRFEIVFTPGKDYTTSTALGFLTGGTTISETEIALGDFSGAVATETIGISNGGVTFYAAGTLSSSTTYTLVGVWNGTSRYDLTLNNSSVSYISGSGAIFDSSDFRKLGKRSNNTNFYDGTIQYFKLTNTSDADILEYLFDEGTGTTLNDNIGTSDGTIVGATWVTR